MQSGPAKVAVKYVFRIWMSHEGRDWQLELFALALFVTVVHCGFLVLWQNPTNCGSMWGERLSSISIFSKSFKKQCFVTCILGFVQNPNNLHSDIKFYILPHCTGPFILWLCSVCFFTSLKLHHHTYSLSCGKNSYTHCTNPEQR